MPEHFLIKKSSGDKQHYSAGKLRNSLRLAGAPDAMIRDILTEIELLLENGMSSRAIYKVAFRLLRKRQHSMAARYSLKNAIMELGPTGYPFEKFVGELFRAQGYAVEVGVIVEGNCVSHEVDVVATSDNRTVMVECKYHNTAGRICNVQVPLYIHSRFNDIRAHLQKDPGARQKSFEGWVFTNTRFSEDAAQYGRCAGLHLVGWDYPQTGSLKDLVQTTGLFPVTAITSITKSQKQQLIDKQIVLCRDLLHNPAALESLNLSNKIRERVITEVNELCMD